jgi:hypothetical protein
MSGSGLVHCPQNFIPSGFSQPQLEQRIPKTLSSRDEHSYHDMAGNVTAARRRDGNSAPYQTITGRPPLAVM